MPFVFNKLPKNFLREASEHRTLVRIKNAQSLANTILSRCQDAGAATFTLWRQMQRDRAAIVNCAMPLDHSIGNKPIHKADSSRV